MHGKSPLFIGRRWRECHPKREVTTSDDRVLTDLIGSVYDAAGDTELWGRFLGKVAGVTQAAAAALVVHESRSQLYTLAASWMMDPQALQLYQQHYGAVDVWAIRGKSKPAGYVCTSESLCRPEELAGTEIYNDFLVPYGITQGMFGVVANDTARRWGSISFYKDDSRNEFGSSELQTLNQLIPHIQRAFALHFKFSELKARAEGLGTALNMLSTGVTLVGANGEIVLMNSQAEEQLRSGDGLRVLRGRLSAAVPSEAARLRAVICGAAGKGNARGTSAGGTIFISRRNRRPLSVMVAPLRNVSIGLGCQASAVLFVSDPEQNVELPAGWLRRCYGLTAAEARLALILLEGRSLKEAAELCSVTHGTARSQLKAVFSKTQVRRQSELVRVLLAGRGPVWREAIR